MILSNKKSFALWHIRDLTITNVTMYVISALKWNRDLKDVPL